MAGVKEYVHTVQYYETDKMGITHHSNYIRWMEEGRVDFLTQIGWPFERLEREGFVSPVTKVECTFVRPCTFADEIIIHTDVKEFDGIRLTFAYKMMKTDGTVVCVGSSGHCFIDTVKGRPIRADRACPEFCAELMKHRIDTDGE